MLSSKRREPVFSVSTDWLIAGLVITVAVAFACSLVAFVRFDRRTAAGAAMALVVALLLAACARPAPSDPEYNEKEIKGRPTLVVSVSDKELRDKKETEFAFKVAGIPFVVANDRLHTILEGDLIVRDELWGGFSFLSVLPDITPFTDHDVYLFGRPSTESNFISITVERFCPTFREMADCDAKANIATIFSTGPYIALSDDWPIEPVAGLTPFLHERQSGNDPTKYEPKRDIYDIGDTMNPDRDSYVSCDRIEHVPVPHCEHRFIWKGALRVKLTYKRSNIHNWREIYLKSLQTLEDMTTQVPGTSGKETVYFPKEYYHG